MQAQRRGTRTAPSGDQKAGLCLMLCTADGLSGGAWSAARGPRTLSARQPRGRAASGAGFARDG